VGAAAILPLLSTLNAYFIADDFGLIQLFHAKPPLHFLTLFTSPWTEMIYGSLADELRPLVELSYQVDSMWGPGNPFGYHLGSIALHTANALLVLAGARRLAHLSWPAATFAGMAFALMPVQAEVGAWISGRADSIPAAFYLGSLLAFGLWRQSGAQSRERPLSVGAQGGDSGLPSRELFGSVPFLVISIGLFFLALFSKQSAITMLGTLVAYDVLVERRLPWAPWRTVVPYVPFLLLTAVYIGLRYVLFGNAVRENQIVANTFVFFALGQATQLQMLATGSQVLRVGGPWPALALAGLGAALASVALALPRIISGRAPSRLGALLYFGPIWWFITVAPLAVTYLSSRHLYLTAAGFAIVLGIAFETLWSTRSRARRAAACAAGAALLVFYGVHLQDAVGEWNASGARSLRIAQEVWREGAAAPPGSLMLIDAPASNAPVYEWQGIPALVFAEDSPGAGPNPPAWTFIWSWAAPFVYGAPFAPPDLATRVGFVEPPGVYCCPEDQWLRRTQATIAAWRDQAERAPVIALTWDGSGGLVRWADEPRLREAAERILEARNSREASQLLREICHP
jgi:hypothetical protein